MNSPQRADRPRHRIGLSRGTCRVASSAPPPAQDRRLQLGGDDSFHALLLRPEKQAQRLTISQMCRAESALSNLRVRKFTSGWKTKASGDPDARTEQNFAERAERSHRKGHGHRAASEYSGARKVHCRHGQLKAGDNCPSPLCGGRLYDLNEPTILLQFTGNRELLNQARKSLGAEVVETNPTDRDTGEQKRNPVPCCPSCGTILTLIRELKRWSGLPP